MHERDFPRARARSPSPVRRVDRVGRANKKKEGPGGHVHDTAACLTFLIVHLRKCSRAVRAKEQVRLPESPEASSRRRGSRRWVRRPLNVRARARRRPGEADGCGPSFAYPALAERQTRNIADRDEARAEPGGEREGEGGEGSTVGAGEPKQKSREGRLVPADDPQVESR